MSRVKLSSISNAHPLFQGCFFRFRRLGSEDEIVEYIFFQTWEASGLGLVWNCEYEAGPVLAVLPTEARVEDAIAISPQWLIHHWKNASIALPVQTRYGCLKMDVQHLKHYRTKISIAEMPEVQWSPGLRNESVGYLRNPGRFRDHSQSLGEFASTFFFALSPSPVAMPFSRRIGKFCF